MNQQEIAKAANFLCLAYNREISNPLLELMMSDYADWEYPKFMEAAQTHRGDPQRGRFFPSLADMQYQIIGDRSQAKAKAAIDFDNNPLIDGTGKYQADRETYPQRDGRKRSYIARQAFAFEGEQLGNKPAELNGPRSGMQNISEIKSLR